jgi:hypothetical protein
MAGRSKEALMDSPALNALSLDALKDLRWKINVRISELERESGVMSTSSWQWKLIVKIVGDAERMEG